MKVLAKYGVIIGQPMTHHINPEFISSISILNESRGFMGKNQTDEVSEAYIYVVGQERSGPYTISGDEYTRILPELQRLPWWE